LYETKNPYLVGFVSGMVGTFFFLGWFIESFLYYKKGGKNFVSSHQNLNKSVNLFD